MKMNLLPKDERPLKQSQVRWGFLVGLVGFLALAAALSLTWLETAKLDALSLAHQDALSREAMLRKQVQSINAIREDIKALESTESVYNELLAVQAGSFAAVPDLVDHPFTDLWIEGLIWKADTISLVGYTRNMASITGLLNYLTERSEHVELKSAQPMQVNPAQDTMFYRFAMDVQGVKASAAAELN
jgi:Tfp pilus assembly protein PilN